MDVDPAVYLELIFYLILFIAGLLSPETKKKHGCRTYKDSGDKTIARDIYEKAVQKRKEKPKKKKRSKTIKVKKKRDIVLLTCSACGSNIENDRIEIYRNLISAHCGICNNETSFTGNKKRKDKDSVVKKKPIKDIPVKLKEPEIIRCQSCAMPIEPGMVSKYGKFVILNCIYCGAVHYIKK